ncbi:MAG: acyl-CoA dehydrogenase family protein, partial [Candidatus Alkanophagales archaeon]
MDFELTEEQREVKNAAREFAEREFTRELALECEEQGRFPYELWRKAAELGFIGINIPEEYGGQGMGLLEKVLVLEEFFRADPSLGFIYITTFGSELILNNGTEEQKRKYVTPVARGEAIMGMAVTEPEHGSDITKLDTVAVKDGDEWVINGTKTFISNGPIADWLVVVCQTDPEAKPPYRGQSMFIVETDADGFEAVELRGKMGMRIVKTGELYFRDVRVPEENLLGELNRGFYQLLGMLNETRICLAARCVGIAQGALERSVRYAKQRKQFG